MGIRWMYILGVSKTFLFFTALEAWSDMDAKGKTKQKMMQMWAQSHI